MGNVSEPARNSLSPPRAAAAAEARGWQIKAATKDPRLLTAGLALCENRIPHAEALLREHLQQFPTEVAAIRMLAEVAARLGRLRDAENLLIRCLELAPDFDGARHNYASVLLRRNKLLEALREVDRLLAADPRNPAHRNLKAAVLTHTGDYEEAIALYHGVLAEYPAQDKVWLNYGHALKTAGREVESIEAYRQCIALTPATGEAYWSLANLKTFRFSAADLEAMRLQLERTDLAPEARFHFEFALGKACEDRGDFGESCAHYSHGNRLRRAQLPYDPGEITTLVERSKELLTREFFLDRTGFGATAPDPIFIVGLPRSGSTLIEQILSSHSAVEGTMELPDLPQIAAELGATRKGSPQGKYPLALAGLTANECAQLGQQYLRQAQLHRKSATPFFVDKLPNNFMHVGLIQLILPNARIIDARRRPLACCVSVFKQHFARGQSFAYGLEDIGHYYRDYVDLMAHFDEVLPGRVHRVSYESLVDDIAGEVRRLLDYCGLPFEERCLRFHENRRAVRTASSQQVRQPLFREGLEQWRRFDPWLGPLRQAVGPILAGDALVPTV
ncbi:MAG TPA: sulfotransferase [Steroidobacteraceae bacterium]